MRLLFELSGELPALPAAEALSVARTLSPSAREILKEPGAIAIEVPPAPGLRAPADFPFRRLAYTHTGLAYLFSCPYENVGTSLKEAAERSDIPEKGTFRIRVKGFGERRAGSRKLAFEKELGGVLFPQHGIDLVKPDISIRVLVSENAHAGLVLHEQEKRPFAQRSPTKRPFFSPITMGSKLARAMVNLALVKEGGRVLDPFCGTGGILLEAGLMGMHTIGSDLEFKMVEGCEKNMRHFGLKDFRLFRADIGGVVPNLDTLDIDAVVTDAPYGRACGTRGEKVTGIYERLFRTASQVLGPGRRLVLALHDPTLARPGPEFAEVQRFECRVHRSLTRHLMVFEKK